MSHYLTLKGIGRPVAYFPKLGVYLDSVTAGVFLCQMIYWHDKATSELGVYKTSEEIQEETGLTYREQVTARKKLCSLGLIEETNKRLEHKIYFKFNESVFDEWLSGCLGIEIPERRKRISGNAENAIGRTTKTHFVLQENTQENTNINGKPEKFVFKKALINFGAASNLADDWITVRKNKKASNTETALNGFISQVEKSGLDVNTVLKICVDNSWSGFKQSWLANINMSDYLEQPKQATEQKTNDFDWTDF
ncbi:hypothetical protein [Acinetobacter phage BUCT629]|uniref:Uncharacterized protein n=3 Tax=Obolenskvirus TaxID=1915205 RepID=A0A1V0DZ80_9CAUD|nr:replication initiation O-like [Acinetobacter phage WCHABP12]YP_009604561.1 replication initiation O-like [Acinetobacter phage WCHABP1]AYP69059.1 hypothetical protein [Acinetobacter phage vB_AbaM_IME512]QZI85383.1 hypothetical protein [Acinetobacter phage BUCT629]WJZ47783.1 replication initiation O-like protein [Acinetobacter phage NJ02]WPH63949.1 DNA replication protein [Acinetobacter phage HZY2308]ARB06780.1 hypothetical protein ABP12_00039 [Acinetobacter phage WCHABP12]